MIPVACGKMTDVIWPFAVSVQTGWTAILIARTTRFGTAMPLASGCDFSGPPGTLRTLQTALLATIAPGEWLLFGTEPPALADDPDFLAIDVSAGHCILQIEAQFADRALAAYCPLDRAVDLAPGRIASSLFGAADTLLAMNGDGLLLIADNALSAYLMALLHRLEQPL